MSYYRLADDGASYDFTYSLPLARPLFGTTGVSFNTFQPSANISEADYLVYNWLTIVNVSNAVQDYTINTYDQLGNLLQTRNQSIAAFGRADIDGGHVLVGSSVVGFHEIIPSNSEAPYLAQLIRYGTNAPAGQAVSAYRFSFPLGAHAGTGEPIFIPMSNQFDETNWVEVINTTSASTTVQLDFYSANGEKTTVSKTLGAHAQEHLYAPSYGLGSGERGYVKVSPETSNSIIAQSMFYYRDSALGISVMSGIIGREALGSQYNGSYNLFLGMENWLSVSNITDSSVTLSVSQTGSASSGSQAVTLGAHETTQVAVHNSAELMTSPDTYGFLSVEPDASQSLIVDLQRIRYLSEALDFSFPTAVRAQ